MHHRLVAIAIAFIRNTTNKRRVDHIDTDKANNHFTNLRWATHRENEQKVGITARNTSGVVGVDWRKDKKEIASKDDH